jgi:hypothetical protein
MSITFRSWPLNVPTVCCSTLGVSERARNARRSRSIHQCRAATNAVPGWTAPGSIDQSRRRGRPTARRRLPRRDSRAPGTCATPMQPRGCRPSGRMRQPASIFHRQQVPRWTTGYTSFPGCRAPGRPAGCNPAAESALPCRDDQPGRRHVHGARGNDETTQRDGGLHRRSAVTQRVKGPVCQLL